MSTDFGQRVRDGLEATGRYAAGHQRQIIVVVAVTALVALSVGLASIQMSIGMTLYTEDDSRAANDWETLKNDFGAGNNVFVLVKSVKSTTLRRSARSTDSTGGTARTSTRYRA